MTIFSRFWLHIACTGCYVGIAVATPLQAQVESLQPAQQSNYEVDHLDKLKVNPGLSLSEVLDRSYARASMQASLQSSDAMVAARSSVAKAMLPSAPAVSVINQNDAIGSGRGERGWQAELELPICLPKQRGNRLLEDYRQSPIWLEAQTKVGLAETERELAQV